MNTQDQIEQLRKSLEATDLQNSILQSKITRLEKWVERFTPPDEEEDKPSYDGLKEQIRELMTFREYQWISIDGNGDVYISTHQLNPNEKYNSWDEPYLHEDDSIEFKLSHIGTTQINGLDWKQCQWKLHELLNKNRGVTAKEKLVALLIREIIRPHIRYNYRWAAMDVDGDVYAYASKPDLDENTWQTSDDHRLLFMCPEAEELDVTECLWNIQELLESEEII